MIPTRYRNAVLSIIIALTFFVTYAVTKSYLASSVTILFQAATILIMENTNAKK